MMLLLILLLHQFYMFVSFPAMPSRLSYLVERFEPPLSSIFLMIDIELSWRVRVRSKVLSWGRMGTKQPSPCASPLSDEAPGLNILQASLA
jgi:hypothetical protein